MVINSKYKFIFVHIPKSAGSSLTKALSGLPGNRPGWSAGTKHETLAEFDLNVSGRMSFLQRRLHTPADYFRFGIVRNPWDRMSSLYHYLVETRVRPEIVDVPTFREFLLRARNREGWYSQLRSLREQVDYFLNGENRLKIDYLGHFEFMAEDIEMIKSKVGIRFVMPRINVSSNNSVDYRAEYDSGMVDIVAGMFSRDIDLFGYGFSRPQPANRISGPVDLRLASEDACRDMC